MVHQLPKTHMGAAGRLTTLPADVHTDIFCFSASKAQTSTDAYYLKKPHTLSLSIVAAPCWVSLQRDVISDA